MSSPFIVYCIHHSHTDIGYTAPQEIIEHDHIAYIRQVLDILNHAHTDRPEWLGFKWICESYWCVERFLAVCTEAEKEAFASYVKRGEIGLSANYLNLTDLVSARVLEETQARTSAQMRAEGIDMTCAMSADVNGYGWGYVDALVNNGCKHLLTCVHTHHGFYPLGRKQQPFYWLSPKGQKLLVWNGEHYHIGNEMGIAQAPAWEYNLRDGLSGLAMPAFEKAEARIAAYVRSLREAGYTYDFAPICVSGRMTDNSPPSTRIIDFIRAYNAAHGDTIQLQMATLEDFFARISQAGQDIPTYAGDWPDWWADGVGSTPQTVQHYREASRAYDMLRSLDAESSYGTKALQEKALYNLMFYAEHTWGASSSISDPFLPEVNRLGLRKHMYAEIANETASRALDDIAYALGKTALALPGALSCCAVNPHDAYADDLVFVDMELPPPYDRFELVEKDTGVPIAFQVGRQPRGTRLYWRAELSPKEIRQYALRPLPPLPLTSAGRTATQGSDRVEDLWNRKEAVLDETGSTVSIDRIETPFFSMRLQMPEGIVSIFDKRTGREMLRGDSGLGAFAPIYEATDDAQGACETRRLMGRNRKAPHTLRDIGKMTDIAIGEDGPLFVKVTLTYDLAGAEACAIILTVHKTQPRVDVDFRLHKQSRWQPENVYLALPFSTGSDDETFYIDKTGAIVRPRIDQLPATCTDFYAVQNGIAFINRHGAVAVAMPDTPLIMMGEMAAHEIRLAGEPGTENIAPVYAWVMNNFWETNFAVDLGGFHQYRYTLLSREEANAAQVFETLKTVNGGLMAFSIYE